MHQAEASRAGLLLATLAVPSLGWPWVRVPLLPVALLFFCVLQQFGFSQRASQCLPAPCWALVL